MLAQIPLRLVPEWLLERWILVAYLIINWNVKEVVEGVQIRPDKRFYTALARHVTAYVQEGVMPPAEIATAVLNLADDMMANRPMNLRAGDYIAIQNFVRGRKEIE